MAAPLDDTKAQGEVRDEGQQQDGPPKWTEAGYLSVFSSDIDHDVWS